MISPALRTLIKRLSRILTAEQLCFEEPWGVPWIDDMIMNNQESMLCNLFSIGILEEAGEHDSAYKKYVGKNNKYQYPKDVLQGIRYVVCESKRKSKKELVYKMKYGVAEDPEIAASEMNTIFDLTSKRKGPYRRCRHLFFNPSDKYNDQKLMIAACKAVTEEISKKYQVVSSVHFHDERYHIHIIFNVASYIDGLRWPGKNNGKAKDNRVLRQAEFHRYRKIIWETINGSNINHI